MEAKPIKDNKSKAIQFVTREFPELTIKELSGELGEFPISAITANFRAEAQASDIVLTDSSGAPKKRIILHTAFPFTINTPREVITPVHIGVPQTMFVTSQIPVDSISLSELPTGHNHDVGSGNAAWIALAQLKKVNPNLENAVAQYFEGEVTLEDLCCYSVIEGKLIFLLG
jgi:hypothetical protein